jgi:hypothetical protein
VKKADEEKTNIKDKKARFKISIKRRWAVEEI